MYERVKRSIRPEITLINGPPACGKSTIADFVCKSQNAGYLNAYFIKTNSNEEKVRRIAEELHKRRVGQRIVVEDFPENLEQALLFTKNYQQPTKVVNLICPFSECLDNEAIKDEDKRRPLNSLKQKCNRIESNLPDIKKY